MGTPKMTLDPINTMGEFIEHLKKNLSDAEVVTAADSGYRKGSEIFNTFYEFTPAAIVYCTHTDDVQVIMNLVYRATFGLKVRTRSGGHDHEGECMGDNAVIIDLSRMKKVIFEEGFAIIEPGLPFEELIGEMNKRGLALPHGTCSSVHLAGYTFGGGWGPWTRWKGMACESLLGARIVLGNGERLDLFDRDMLHAGSPGADWKQPDEAGKEMMWALRGGGGFNYGVVTALVMRTFPLPAETAKFTVSWNAGPALQILKRWEELIAPEANIDLIGTNLKIVGMPRGCEGKHPVAFYGYYKSDTEVPNFPRTVKEIVEQWFTGDLTPDDITVDPGKETPKGEESEAKYHWARFSAWDRNFNWHGNTPKPLLSQADPASPAGMLQMSKMIVGYIPPEVDLPAPHKISSKLVKPGNDGGGLGDAGRIALLKTLESGLISEGGMANGLDCYVTLGAISGSFYDRYNKEEHIFPNGSAFPYKKSPYTIQYQVWWNQKDEPEKNKRVVHFVPDALRWIAQCRNTPIAETQGAFISFKDDTISPADYYQESYGKLQEIKKRLTKDPRSFFGSIKTGIDAKLDRVDNG